nr:hypothetical protein [Acetobacter syzygii]
MSLALRKERDLFNDPRENGRILPYNGQSFFTLNRIENKRLQQKTYRLNQLEYVLSHISNDRDTYMSQALFSKPCRRALYVDMITHGYVDLDIYKDSIMIESWMTPDNIAQNILFFCDDNGIPKPSAIISSGRGIYLKYYWSQPIPRKAAGRAVAVNKNLVKRFSDWGADPQCVDVSRILRVVGTINSKNGEPVRILHQSESNGQVLTYDFEMFGDEVLPFTMSEIRGFRQAQKERYEAKGQIISLARERVRDLENKGQKGFNKYDWCWKVVEDIRLLAEIRHEGTVSEGERALFAHIGASMLGHVIPSHQLWTEIKTWAGLILPSLYVNGELLAHSSSLLKKAKAGDSYKYRSQTIIDRLKITSDEMSQMSCLIDRSEKRKRDRESTMLARRESGVVPRAKYEANSIENLKPWETYGVCRRTYFNWKKSGKV